MSLKDDLKVVKRQVSSEVAQVLPNTKVHADTPARSYPNTPAAFPSGIQFNSDIILLNTISRPMWQTQPAAVQQSKVNTLNMPQATTSTGIKVSPQVTSPNLVAVPDASVSLKGTAGTQVQINWQCSAALSTSTAAASFALFRDGKQIAPVAYGHSPSNGAKFSVSGTYIDSPSIGYHSYALYWATSAGVMTGDGKGRFITAIVLKPQ